MFCHCAGAGEGRGIVWKEEPQMYLRARFSIISPNEMSACKGRAASRKEEWLRGMTGCRQGLR